MPMLQMHAAGVWRKVIVFREHETEDVKACAALLGIINDDVWDTQSLFRIQELNGRVTEYWHRNVGWHTGPRELAS